MGRLWLLTGPFNPGIGVFGVGLGPPFVPAGDAPGLSVFTLAACRITLGSAWLDCIAGAVHVGFGPMLVLSRA